MVKQQCPSQMKEYDFVVIGSGIAGLTFALKAATHGSVAVITKRKGADSNTAWAQGGIACVTSDEDSVELHVRDTLEAGAGLCDEAVVRTVITEGPGGIRSGQRRRAFEAACFARARRYGKGDRGDAPARVISPITCRSFGKSHGSRFDHVWESRVRR